MLRSQLGFVERWRLFMEHNCNDTLSKALRKNRAIPGVQNMCGKDVKPVSAHMHACLIVNDGQYVVNTPDSPVMHYDGADERRQ